MKQSKLWLEVKMIGGPVFLWLMAGILADACFRSFGAVWVSLVRNLVALPCFIFVYFRDNRGILKNTLRRKEGEHAFGGKAMIHWLYSFLLGMVCCAGISITFSAIGLGNMGTDTRSTLVAQDISFYVGIFSTIILAPLVEEFLFRGLVYRRSKLFFLIPASMGISAFLFAILHWESAQIFYTLILGGIACLIYEYTNSLACCILLHGGANILAVVMNYFVPLEGYDFLMENLYVIWILSILLLILLLVIPIKKVMEKEKVHG